MTPEAKVKKQVKQLLRDFGVLPDEGGKNGWYFMPVAGRFGRRGVADFICNVQGHFVAIETKANGGTETDLQKMVAKAVNRTKGYSVCIDETNYDELRSLLARLVPSSW